MKRFLICLALILAVALAYTAGVRDGKSDLIRNAHIYQTGEGIFNLEIDGQVHEYLS